MPDRIRAVPERAQEFQCLGRFGLGHGFGQLSVREDHFALGVLEPHPAIARDRDVSEIRMHVSDQGRIGSVACPDHDRVSSKRSSTLQSSTSASRHTVRVPGSDRPPSQSRTEAVDWGMIPASCFWFSPRMTRRTRRLWPVNRTAGGTVPAYAGSWVMVMIRLLKDLCVLGERTDRLDLAGPIRSHCDQSWSDLG